MQDVTRNKPSVLFLCTGNSCRSQMAEGWARRLFGDIIEAFSAGVEAHGLNGQAVRVMREAGVDISAQRSKRVEEVFDTAFDLVVTVCSDADENCPVFPFPVRKIHASFDDPPRLARSSPSEQEELSHYRRVRDEIRDFVKRLPELLRNEK